MQALFFSPSPISHSSSSSFPISICVWVWGWFFLSSSSFRLALQHSCPISHKIFFFFLLLPFLKNNDTARFFSSFFYFFLFLLALLLVLPAFLLPTGVALKRQPKTGQKSGKSRWQIFFLSLRHKFLQIMSTFFRQDSEECQKSEERHISKKERDRTKMHIFWRDRGGRKEMEASSISCSTVHTQRAA